ncbi:MAG: phosphopantetheine-binding protein [Prochlorococcus sp.]|nr:phosphopantetheine-binding protein [Prochlorococcaceae cyanobacterium Fu_MAG_50]
MDSSEDLQVQSDAKVVEIMISALASLSVPPLELEVMRENISDSADTVSTQAMGLDSLGAMEFCIHLELDHGVVISPEDLLAVEHAAQLLSIVKARLPHLSPDS